MRSEAAVQQAKRRLDQVLSKFLLVKGLPEVNEVTRQLQKTSGPITLGFLNAHAINLCWDDEAVARAFANCDLLLRDGVGAKWLCRLLGLGPGINMNGTDYIPALLARSRGLPIAIFGTCSPHLESAAQKLRSQGFDLVHAEDGFQSDEYYAELLKSRPAAIVVLAMGMPRQERCAAYLKRELHYPCIIICGGAIVDFIGGKTRRAPSFLRRSGLEWTYRLLCEPRRLFPRYVTGGMRFAMRAVGLKLSRYNPGPLLGFARELHGNLKDKRNVRKSKGSASTRIVLVSPGGRDGGGGMGTVSRTIAEWFEANTWSGCTVIDSRGSSSVLLSPIYTGVGILQLVYERLRGAGVLHLQLSERLSFPRKASFMAAGKLMGMRVVVHHHGAEFIPVYERANGIYRGAVKWVVQNADTNIVLGKDWLDYLRDRVGLGNSQVELVYNSVADIQPQIEALRNILRLARKPMQYLVLANLSPRKGISEFLQAMKALHLEGRPISAVISGGGEVERYKLEAAELGVGDICTFTGWIGRDEVLKSMASSDALVLPSHHEGLPMSILEALSAGLPVITTPVGAIPEVLSEGVDCLLVPAGNADSLANAMRRLADEPLLRAELRRNGRLTYERMFAVEKYMQSICNIYGMEAVAA